jgi:hypothetical protein
MTQALGWSVLLDAPDRAYVSGAACRPWLADVVFEPVPAERFREYAVPDRVKIAWSIEAERAGPGITRLSTETRVVATDAGAHAKLERYWRRFGLGIVLIRLLVLPAVRREAERRCREGPGQRTA